MFLGICPVCGYDYTRYDAEVGHEGLHKVIVDDDELEADLGDVVERVCETCKSKGRARRTTGRD